MAKESTIRNKAKEKLVSEGYVVWIPTRNRFGAGVTTWQDGKKAGDDIWNIFDLIGWKEDKLIFIQYTSVSNIRKREKKIRSFIDKHKLSIPKSCRAEVWGYKDRKGFTHKIKIN